MVRSGVTVRSSDNGTEFGYGISGAFGGFGVQALTEEELREEFNKIDVESPSGKGGQTGSNLLPFIHFP